MIFQEQHCDLCNSITDSIGDITGDPAQHYVAIRCEKCGASRNGMWMIKYIEKLMRPALSRYSREAIRPETLDRMSLDVSRHFAAEGITWRYRVAQTDPGNPHAINVLVAPKVFSAKAFELQFDRWPENDDLERINCPTAGKDGHRFCGFCETHWLPRWECGCPARRPDETETAQ